MRRRSCASRRRTEGFVLLYTLWLLLGGVALLAAVSALAMNRARDATAAMRELRSASAAESAAQEALFKLIIDGRLALPALARVERPVDGVRLQVSAVPAAGLIDLNTADTTALRTAFSIALGNDGPTLLEGVRRHGNVRYYDQLVADGVTPGRLSCLLRYVTLASGRPEPVFEFAPGHVRSALELNGRESGTESSAVPAPQSLAGESIRIDVVVMEADAPSRHLFMDALITGRLDRPIHLLDWRWLPVEAAAIANPRCAG